MKLYKEVPFKKFSQAEHETWKMLFHRQAELRDKQLHPIFSEGIKKLNMDSERVPDIYEINERLKTLTGWQGIPVEGLEEDESFYQMLGEKKFPIGNFIRNRDDLSYTPAPDVFHDLYGHLPFFANKAYADFCYDLGVRATRHVSDPNRLKQFARLFWFGVEFSVIDTPKGRRIFGAGIASSHGECEYALSDRPNVLPFSTTVIKDKDFKIDEFQKDIFLLKTESDLYDCLDRFEQQIG